MSNLRESYRLLSYGTLQFHSGVGTRRECEKRKTAYTRGRRKDPFVAGYRVSVFPVKVDPKFPRRLSVDVVAGINEWRDIMSKRPVTVRSRTKEPRPWHMSSL
jgi:hypothetical protein